MSQPHAKVQQLLSNMLNRQYVKNNLHIKSELFLCEIILHIIGWYDFFFENISPRFLGTQRPYNLSIVLSRRRLKRRNYFLCHTLYTPIFIILFPCVQLLSSIWGYTSSTPNVREYSSWTSS